MSDFNYSENYAFIKTTIEDDEVKNTLTYEFEELSLHNILNEMTNFLRASGFEYVSTLVAVKDDGSEISSEEDVLKDMEIIFDFNKTKAEIHSMEDYGYRKKPDLSVVSNENEDKD